MKFLLPLVLLAVPPAFAQENPSSLTDRLNIAIQRDGNGHSPTDDEITAMANPTAAPALDDVKTAIPLILKALESSDVPLRTLALTAAVALQVVPDPAPGATPQLPGPPIYKPEVGDALAPAVTRIASHLTEESQANRALAATALGGFTSNPPAAVYPPLLAFLKRDDAVTSVGQQVVADLLQLGPLSAETSTAVARYLKRSDQTPDARANLVDAIASKTNQSQALNAAVLNYLTADDPSLRARVILSLPQLDLAPDVFADTKARVAAMAADGNENLQVINAAKAVAPCWTATRMLAGCPVYQ